MQIEQMMAQAQRIREAQGLHVCFTGPDYVEPFHAYAANAQQRDRWIAQARPKGNSAEVVGA